MTFRRLLLVQLQDKVTIYSVDIISINTLVGVVKISYESGVCCSDKQGWLHVGETLLDPDTCSDRTCTAGNLAYWRSQLVFPGYVGLSKCDDF